MNKLKAFFYVYYRSLTSIPYYKEILSTPTAFSIKYLGVLAVLASLLSTLIFTIVGVPRITKFFDSALSSANELYPQELVITTKDNEWSINQPEPLVIPFPELDTKVFGIPEAEMGETTESFNERAQIPENLIIFDHEGTIDDLDTQSALILVNSKNVVVKQTNKIESYPIENLGEAEITRADFDEAIAGMRNFSRYIPYLLGVMLFLGSLFYYFLFRLFYLLFVAVVLALVGLVVGPKLKFVEMFRVGLHTMTLPVTVEILLNLIGQNIRIAGWFILLNVIYGVVVLVNLAKSQEAPVQQQEPKV